MYDKKILGLAEAERATQAIIEEASKDPSSPCAVAISDCNGHLVYLARMDGAPWHAVIMAIKKAYTAARMRRDTRWVLEYVKKQGWDDSAFGIETTPIPGGVSIVEPSGTVSYGGIGISGRPADLDEVLAFVGLKALQDFLWPSS